MIRLILTNNDNFLYNFIDEKGNTYTKDIEFIDVDKPNIGNFVYMSDVLLHSNDLLSFGSLDSNYGRPNLDLDDVDIIKVVDGDKEIYLKRLYG